MQDPADQEISVPLRVLVTGGKGTLGEAVVVAFAKAGHQMFFQYHSDDETAARLSDTFGATAFKIDFAGDFRLPRHDFDVLVNCAGINEPFSTWRGPRQPAPVNGPAVSGPMPG